MHRGIWALDCIHLQELQILKLLIFFFSQCRSKSNKPPSAAAGSGGQIISGNGSVHNGLVLGVNGKSTNRRRKSGSGRYEIDDETAEGHDLTIREDLNGKAALCRIET